MSLDMGVLFWERTFDFQALFKGETKVHHPFCGFSHIETAAYYSKQAANQVLTDACRLTDARRLVQSRVLLPDVVGEEVVEDLSNVGMLRRGPAPVSRRRASDATKRGDTSIGTFEMLHSAFSVESNLTLL